MRVVVLACAALLVAAGTASAKVGPSPVVATPSGGVWATTSAGELVRVDATSGRVLARTASLGFPTALAGDGGRLWAIDGRDNRIVRIAAPGPIAATRGLPGFPSALAVGDTSVWAVVYQGRGTGTVLLRVDPDSLAIRGRFHLGARAAQLAVDGARVWLGIDPASRRGVAGLVAIGERRGALLFRRHLRGNVRGISADGRRVWLLMERRRGSRMIGIDARTGTRTASVSVPANAGVLAAGHGRVWVGTLCGGPTCRLERAAVRGYDAAGRLVAGPFLPWNACRRRLPRSSPLFLSGIAATPGGVALTVGDGHDGVQVVLISRTGGVQRCAPV
jgi:hypothetical protein